VASALFPGVNSAVAANFQQNPNLKIYHSAPLNTQLIPEEQTSEDP
jgi:hypothetical protein